MIALTGRDGLAAAQVAAALLAFASVTAACVALAGPGEVRNWLGFGFAGIPNSFGEILSVLFNNLRLLGGIFAASWVWQLARSSDSPHPVDAWLLRAIGGFCDMIVVGAALANALVVGAGLGAYGGRMIAGILPHGMVELGAYSVALGLYRSARHEQLDRERWLTAALLSTTGLASAAVIEVLASL
jgi:hypothetical protein